MSPEFLGLEIVEVNFWRQNSWNSVMITLLLFTFPWSSGSNWDNTEDMVGEMGRCLKTHSTSRPIHAKGCIQYDHILSQAATEQLRSAIKTCCSLFTITCWHSKYRATQTQHIKLV